MDARRKQFPRVTHCGYCVVGFYHEERSHQGLGNSIIMPGAEVGRAVGQIECRERLGGLLRYYYRHAAQ